MAVAYVATTAVQVASTAPVTTFSIPKPTGLAVGDLMVAQIVTSGGTISAPPTGWADIAVMQTTVTNPKVRVMYKIADATDVAASTFDFGTASTYGTGSLSHFTGVDQTTPLDFAASTFESSATVTAFVCPDATVVTAGAMLVGGAGANTGYTATWTLPTNPAAWTDDFHCSVASSKSSELAHCDTTESAGSTGTVTFTLSTSRAGSAWFVGLRPATGGGGGGGDITPSGLASAEAFGSPVVSQPSVVSSWVGAVTDTTATVAVKTAGASACRLKVSTASDLLTSPVFSSSGTPDADGITKLSISGLSANTSYYFGVEMDGSSLLVDGGSFKTFPTGQASFSFGFASCQKVADTPVWSDILARDPLFFMQLGDFWYDDGASQTEASYRSHYDTQLAGTHLHEFFRKKPVAYAWSDHDFGMNNNAFGDGYANRGNAQAVYDQYVPYWERPDSGGAIYQTFVVGRVRFIMMDTMSYKTDWSGTDNSSKTILGATQKQWVKDTIAAATEKLIVISSDVPWIGAAVAGDDAWDGYTTERTELTDFFLQSGKNICIIAGDMHAVAADDGTNADGIRVFQSAPLHNTSSIKGGPWSEGVYPASGSTTVEQYSIIDVTDSGTSIHLDYTGYSANVAKITYSVTYSLVDATGIASAEAFGSTTVAGGNLTIAPAGIGTAEVFGNADVEGPLLISPTGIASQETFPAGSPAINTGAPLDQTLTAVGVASAQAFGVTTVGRQVYIVSPPTVLEAPAALERPLNRLRIPRGITVYLQDGVYTQIRYWQDGTLDNADAVYVGGHEYEVDLATATELVAEGFTMRTESR